MPASDVPAAEHDDLLPEYDFDYDRVKPNRFAARFAREQKMVVLDPGVAAVFTTADSVNGMVRAIIQNMAKKESSDG